MPPINDTIPIIGDLLIPQKPTPNERMTDIIIKKIWKDLIDIFNRS